MEKKKKVPKVKKPLYKKWWFWVIAVLVLGGIGNAIDGDTDTVDAPPTSSVYRGTLPSQKPSQSPTQTQAPEETVQSTPTPTPEPTPTPAPTAKPTPVPTSFPTASNSGGGGNGNNGNWGDDRTTNEITGSLSRTAYWTPSGKSYHFSKSCPSLSRSKNIRTGTLQDALNAGKKDPCNNCAGGH